MRSLVVKHLQIAIRSGCAPSIVVFNFVLEGRSSEQIGGWDLTIRIPY